MMSVLSAEAIRPLITDTYIGDLEEAKKESDSDRIGGSETDTIQILTRKQELETMKKIGMTGKQMRNMLLFEGGLYICILAAGIAVAGTVMMYILAWYMERKLLYFVFHYPGWWIAVLLGEWDVSTYLL